MATDQKPQNSKRSHYPPSHRLNITVMLNNIIFYGFCGFCTGAINIMFKLHHSIWRLGMYRISSSFWLAGYTAIFNMWPMAEQL